MCGRRMEMDDRKEEEKCAPAHASFRPITSLAVRTEAEMAKAHRFARGEKREGAVCRELRGRDEDGEGGRRARGRMGMCGAIYYCSLSLAEGVRGMREDPGAKCGSVKYSEEDQEDKQ